MQSTVYDDLLEKYLDFAAVGNVDKVTSCLKVMSNVDIRNEKGWTALMFAARNGHLDVIKLIVEKGCDVDMINSSGHTAADIAAFWNHHDVVKYLTPSNDTGGTADAFPDTKLSQKRNYFCSNLLDRSSHRRKDTEWLESQMANKRSKFVLFVDLKPLVVPFPDDNAKIKLKAQLRLLDASCEDITSILSSKPLIVFLGVENKFILNKREEICWFAVGLDTLSEDDITKIHPHAQVMDGYIEIMQLPEKEAGALSQARSILAWHDRYQYCATCGGQTRISDAGYKRTCLMEQCRSHNGVHNTSYPRTDPTVIAVVVSPDKSQILLGRGKRFPRTMFSCLAGFIEPGESIEDAVRREVHEETAVTISHVEYHSCQPWPMPASLMIGCIAYATSTEIMIDPEELADARWFSRGDVLKMMSHQHPQSLFVPPEQAISHQLIRTWISRTSNL